MALRTQVYVGDITNLHDARYCAGMGVEFIGFPIEPSRPVCVPVEKYKDIAGWVSGPKLVGELSGPVADLAEYYFDYLATDNPDMVQTLHQAGYQVFLRVWMGEERQQTEALLHQYRDYVAGFILGSEYETTDGELLSCLAEWSRQFPVFLAFGFDGHNVLDILEQVKPSGLALHGGEEIAVGLNDFEQLAEILEAIEE